MTLLNCLIVGLVLDITCIVGVIYFAWKNRKISNKVERLQEQLIATTLNPQKARRYLKKQRNQL